MATKSFDEMFATTQPVEGVQTGNPKFDDMFPNSIGIKALDEIEDTFKNKKVEALKDLGRVVQTAPGRLAAGVAQSVGGLARYAGHENYVHDSNLDQLNLEQGMDPFTARELAEPKPELVKWGQEVSESASAAKKGADLTAPTKTYVGKIGNTIVDSMGQMLPGVAIGIGSGGSGAGFGTGIFLSTFGSKFSELMDKGLSFDNAASRAGWEGATEAGTEMIGFGAFHKLFKGQGGISSYLRSSILKEYPSEAIATALQNSMDAQDLKKGMFDPNNLGKSLDYLLSKSHASDQIDTFFTTLGLTGTTAASAKGVETLANKIAPPANPIKPVESVTAEPVNANITPTGESVEPLQSAEQSATGLNSTTPSIVDSNLASVMSELGLATPTAAPSSVGELSPTSTASPASASPSVEAAKPLPTQLDEIANIADVEQKRIALNNFVENQKAIFASTKGKGSTAVKASISSLIDVANEELAKLNSIQSPELASSIQPTPSEVLPFNEESDQVDLSQSPDEIPSIEEIYGAPSDISSQVDDSPSSTVGQPSEVVEPSYDEATGNVTIGSISGTPVEVIAQIEDTIETMTALQGQAIDQGKEVEADYYTQQIELGKSTIEKIQNLTGSTLSVQPLASQELDVDLNSLEEFEQEDSDELDDLLETLRPTNEEDFIFTDSAIPPVFGNIVENLARLVGIKTKMIIVDPSATSREILNFTNTLVNPVYKVKEHDSLGTIQPALNPYSNELMWVITVNYSKEGLSEFPTIALETMVHEAIGHVTMYEKVHTAPENIQLALMEDFRKFVQKKDSGLTDADVVKMYNEFSMSGDILSKSNSHKVLYMRGKENQSYIFNHTKDFPTTDGSYQSLGHEWMANGIAKALLSHHKAQSVIAEWWADLANKISILYNNFKSGMLDTFTGLKSQRDFVDFLIKENEVKIENFNFKLTPLLEVALKQVTKINAKGKRVLKSSKEMPKWGSKSPDGKFLALTNREKAQSGIKIVELKNANGGYNGYKIVDRFGTTMFAFSSQDYSKGDGWAMVSYIRDMLVATNNRSYVKPKKTNLSLNGQKFTINSYAKTDPVFRAMLGLANKLALETMTPDEMASTELQQKVVKQRLLEVMSGVYSPMRALQGRPDYTKLGDRLVRLMERWVAKNPSMAKEVVESLNQETLEDIETPVTMFEEEEIDKDLKPSSEATQIEIDIINFANQIDGTKIIFRKNPNALEGDNNLSQFIELVKDNLKFGNKTYYDLPASERIKISETIKQVWNQKVKVNVVEKFLNPIEGLTPEELQMLIDMDMIHELRVYHGTSAVIPDVPTIDKANPDGLYGPGVYMTEDSVDPTTGHLIVTAGYAKPKGPAKWEVDKSLIPEIEDMANYFKGKRSDINILVDKVRKNRIIETPDLIVLKQVLGNTAIKGKVHEADRPNIIPLDINPQPSETFDIDAPVDVNSKPYQWVRTKRMARTARLWTPSTRYPTPEAYANYDWNLFVSENLKTNYDLYRAFGEFSNSKRTTNKLLRAMGYNFITHEGGGITGGVNHQVWIALKDGLIKSSFQAYQDSLVISSPDFIASKPESHLKVTELEQGHELRKSSPKQPQRIKDPLDSNYLLFKQPVQKEKSKKKRRPISKEKLDAKRAKQAMEREKFLNNFSVLVGKAEESKLSIYEYLTQLGVERSAIDKQYRKWLKLTSILSQNSMIERLSQMAGLIDLETGYAGIREFIKSVWPNHSGDINQLDYLGKEVVIAKLQNVLESKLGSRYSFSTDYQANQDSYMAEVSRFRDLKPLQKLSRMLHILEQRVQDKLSTTEAGRHLVDRLRRTLYTTTLWQSDWIRELHEFGKEYYTLDQRLHLHDVYMGLTEAKSEREKEFVRLLTHIAVKTSIEMERMKVKVKFKSGKWEYYKHNPNPDVPYFPHIWKPEDFSNPTEEMIKSVMRDQNFSDTPAGRSEAVKWIKAFGERYLRVESPAFANMERARESELEGWIKDPIEVFTKYVLKSSRRLSILREFGEEPNKALSFIAIQHYRQSSNDPDAMRLAADTINQITGVGYSHQVAELNGLVNHATLVASGLMLMHAAVVQVGVAANVAAKAGFVKTIQGFSQILPLITNSKDRAYNKAWAAMIGADQFTMSRELLDMLDQEDRVKERTDKLMRAFGITQMDSWMRVGSAHVGRMFFVDNYAKFITNNDKRAEYNLKKMGFKTEQMKQEASNPDFDFNKLKEIYMPQASLAFVEQTNFVNNALTQPVLLRNNPFGRVLMLFQKFSFQQHHFLKDLLKDRNGKAFAKYLIASGLTGPILYTLRLLIKGDDPEKVLERDGIAKYIWRSYQAAGGLGLYAEAILGSLDQSHGQTTTPVISVLKQASAVAPALYDTITGEGDDNDYNKLFRGLLMAGTTAGIYSNNKWGVGIGAAVSISKPMLEKALVPNERQNQTSLFGGI